MEETNQIETRRTVLFRGQSLTLLGNELKTEEKAPNFRVLDNEMMPMKFRRTYSGKTAVILSLPSLDTSVCDIETRRFNREAEKMGPNVEILAVSMDLPFAQKRWCGAANIQRVKTYSDHLKADFGKSYGVLVKELRLLARAVFIIDKSGTVKYVQLVPEITDEPDYESALGALKQMVK